MGDEKEDGADSIDYKTNHFDDHKIDMNEIVFSNDKFKGGNPEVKEEKIFYCDYCEKIFRSKYFLDKHSKCHSGEMNGYIECKVSDAKKDINLDNPEVENFKEGEHITEEFQCHDCKKEFVTKSVLEKHLLTHAT